MGTLLHSDLGLGRLFALHAPPHPTADFIIDGTMSNDDRDDEGMTMSSS